ncbi:MAG: hypothetical protein JWM80_3693 [Cyanobacteria bacterium RYN_339]|nr:hypothetical protein [Cyanobacteria bacterium RYN_339]
MPVTAYRLGYQPAPITAPQDQGIRASDAYVAAHDPLRARVGEADLALGVDPGTYFCGGLAHWLAHTGRRGGFIHVPPGSTPVELAAVVALALEALHAATPFRTALVTGFGPFPGVPENPTAAFIAAGLLPPGATGAVLALYGPDGEAYTAMPSVETQLAALGAFDVHLALGVDSRQRLARPRFTIETQSRGMADGPWLGLEELGRAVISAISSR